VNVRRQPVWNDVAVGLGVCALALIVAWQTTLIPDNAVYAKVGPKVIPWLTTAMLGVLGVALTFQGWRGGWDHSEAGQLDYRSLGLLLLGLVLNVALIDVAGFIIASMVLFLLTARAFGSRHVARDAGIGFVLATIAYIGFDRVLGYRIGSGLIERFL
jgi:putative tricarboxylic transport membrane protein